MNTIFILLGCTSGKLQPQPDTAQPCAEQPFFVDEDGDGYGSPYTQISACELMEGYSANNTDCDDSNPEAFPSQQWYLDIDGDAYGDANQPLSSCMPPIGYVLDDSDCDDLDSSRNPAASWYSDGDGDGYGHSDSPVSSCEDSEQASPLAGDCDDIDPMIHPAANEICDGIDNNCSGLIDNDDPDLDIYTQIPMYRDDDLDGYGTEEYIGQFCPNYVGGSRISGDCDDAEELINPEAFELFDNRDQNCDEDAQYHSISDFQSGFDNSKVSSHFGRYLDGHDIDGDGINELLISQKSYDNDPDSGQVDGGRVIWIEGTRAADFSDLAEEQRYWIGETDDELYGIFAGDVDGDTVPDLLVGSRMKNSNAGEVYLISSEASSGLAKDQATWTWAVPDSTMRLGSSLLRVGDVDADGLDDLLVGASHYSEEGSNRGCVTLLLGANVGGGSDLSTSTIITGTSNGDQFGLRTSPAGDVDGDGMLDIMVSSIYADEGSTSTGTTHLFPASDLLTQGFTPVDAVQFHGEAESDKSGSHLADAGDVNGDGYDDLLIGANDHDEVFDQDGAVYLIYGRPYADFAFSNLLSDADAIFLGAYENAGFGDDIEGMGDINGDGQDDFAIGSYLADETGNNRGLVIGILGGNHSGRNDVADVASFMIRGNSSNHRIGQGMARAGDRNADGFEDFWVGSYGYNSYRGRVVLLEGLDIQ